MKLLARNRIFVKMRERRISGFALFALVCGIVALAGVFMPWLRIPLGPLTGTVTGWNIPDVVNAADFFGISFPYMANFYMVFIGSIGIIIATFTSLALTFATPRLKDLSLVCGFITMTSALVAAVGGIELMIDLGAGSIDYGLWICIFAAGLGGIFPGLIMTVKGVDGNHVDESFSQGGGL